MAQGLSPLEWGQESRQSRSSLLSVLAMTRKAVIGGATDGDWYIVHAMDGSGSLREANAKRKIFRCASSRSGSGAEVIAP